MSNTDEGYPRLTHLLLYVSDLKISRDFYVDKLRLSVIYEEGDYIRVGDEGLGIGIHQVYSEDQLGARGIELQLQVDDVDSWYRALSTKGVNFTQAPEDMPWRARHAFLEDPDGYKLSIYTPVRG